jgi:hypothetical protein
MWPTSWQLKQIGFPLADLEGRPSAFTPKAVKELVAKVAPSGDLSSESFLAGLLEFRNTPHECGLSPAQIVFGHQLRSIIPAHRSSYAQHWKAAAAARDR